MNMIFTFIRGNKITSLDTVLIKSCIISRNKDFNKQKYI